MKRRTAIGSGLAIASGLATALLVSCSGDEQTPAPATGGTVSVPTGGVPATNGGAPGTGTGGTTVTASGGALTSSGGMTATQGGSAQGGTQVSGGETGVGGTLVTTGGAAAGGQPVNAGGSAGIAGGGAGGTVGGAPSECAFAGPRPAPALGTWPPPALKLTEVAKGTQPTAIASPRCDNTRIFFTEKWGRVRLIKNGTLVEEPVLDMRDAVLEGGPQGSQGGQELMNQGKRGLVGLAFHPNYEENGRVFVMYVADQGIKGYGTVDHSNLYDDGDMTFAEYKRSATNPDKFDPEPVKVFLQFDKGSCDQCSQHNGGSLEVDVNGFLWASTGDPPPYNNPGSADLNNLNGKLLKFDITGEPKAAGNYPGADPYVASIGIRNAYKFSVDRYTGDIYVGDVGENSWEEITVETYGNHNKDHGWPKREGFQSFMSTSCAGCLDPVYDYGHTGMEGAPGADNCIIGGYVYRGKAIPALQGAYLYGDYGSGKVRAIQVENGMLKTETPHDFNLNLFMGCFGEDAAGELYACDYNNNRIVRLDAQ